MMSLPAANRPSKDIFCRLQAVSCCLFLKTLDLTLLARQDADFFVNHQDDMKHYLGVGNPNLNLHLWPCLMASWWGFSGGIDPNQKNQLHPWSFFFLPQEKLPPKVSLWHVGQVNDKNVPWFSREFATEGGTKNSTKRPCRLVVSGGFKGLLGILLTPKKMCASVNDSIWWAYFFQMAGDDPPTRCWWREEAR